MVYQVGAVLAFARSHGARLVHVKPHGALYNQAAVDDALARAIARGVAARVGELVLVGLASSAAMRRAAEAEGLRFAAEAFADRATLPPAPCSRGASPEPCSPTRRGPRPRP